jgi:hypothetical protein
MYKETSQLRRRIDLASGGRSPLSGLPAQKPQLQVGDAVREKFPMTSVDAETGVVIETYEWGGNYRCVVQCESGREAVFFERELVLDKSGSFGGRSRCEIG